jgi:tetratricopeptide (TPR) repeat protein
VIHKGKEIGKTPLKLEDIPVNESAFQVQLAGYADTNFTLRIQKDSVAKQSIKLTSVAYLQAMIEARLAFEEERFDEAQMLLTTALEIEPNDPAALEMRGQVSQAVTKAKDKLKEDARLAEIARKDAVRKEVIGVIEKAIKAVGGRDAINRFASFKQEVNTTGKKGSADIAARLTLYVQLPDKIRIDQVMENRPKKLGPLTMTVNEGRPINSSYCVTKNNTWQVVPGLLGGQIQQVVPAQLQKKFRFNLYLAECTTIIPLLGADYTLEKLPNTGNTPDGAVGIKVQKAGRPDVSLFFNKDSGLLVRLDTVGFDDRGNSAPESIIYHDYRSFNGMLWPTRTTFFGEGDVSSEGRVQSIEPFRQSYGDIFSLPPLQR